MEEGIEGVEKGGREKKKRARRGMEEVVVVRLSVVVVVVVRRGYLSALLRILGAQSTPKYVLRKPPRESPLFFT
jgi:hypothetical protein